jgi:putative DNA primase/helicase
MTGGDDIRARWVYRDFCQFPPTHKIWVAGNWKPVITGTEVGTWRRIKMVPFDVTIEEKHRDKDLPGKLRRELSGVLNWALAGCLDWQRDGLREPDVVRGATQDYEAEMDEVAQFLDDHCEEGDWIGDAHELYEAFRVFTGSELTRNQFNDRLRQKGYKSHDHRTGREYRTKQGRRGWKGLRLREEG